MNVKKVLAYQLQEVSWYMLHGRFPRERISQDRHGDAYVIGDVSWNTKGRPFELVEGRMARDVPSLIERRV